MSTLSNKTITNVINSSNFINQIVLVLTVLILITMSTWIYRQIHLNTTNCKAMNSLYTDYALVSTINTDLADYQHSLRDYYVKTAFNACSAGQFKNDVVNVCALKNVIGQGARCLDFEVYSLDNKPVIATSSVDDYSIKETYNSVPIEDAFTVIRDYAFSGSTCPNPKDPLIIHLRIMSKNTVIYNTIASSIEELLSDKILGSKYSYENQGKNFGQTLLSDLMDSIILIVDRSNPIFETTNLDEYVNLASNSIFMRCVPYSSGVKFTPDMDELIEYNKKNMTLVIPDLSGTNTNYSAQLAWTCGCQFAAMCFQNFDTNMEVYSMLFDNKGSAFVLKPSALRYVPVTIPYPTPANPNYSYEQRTTSTDYYSLKI